MMRYLNRCSFRYDELIGYITPISEPPNLHLAFENSLLAHLIH